MKKFFKYYFPVVVWMGVIFFLSSMEGNGQSREADFWFYAERKGAHVFEYFVLTLLFLRAFNSHKMTIREKIMSALIFPLAYSMTDEIHQQFVAGRDGKLLDVGIDFFGIVLAVVVWNLWMKHRMRVER
ncbi:MAG: VanZ family protein [Candidatus Moranbacteria bacterium]|nr:VanZ family protein [Candidatus Moranbacteria bacterium]